MRALLIAAALLVVAPAASHASTHGCVEFADPVGDPWSGVPLPAALPDSDGVDLVAARVEADATHLTAVLRVVALDVRNRNDHMEFSVDGHSFGLYASAHADGEESAFYLDGLPQPAVPDVVYDLGADEVRIRVAITASEPAVTIGTGSTFGQFHATSYRSLHTSVRHQRDDAYGGTASFTYGTPC